MKRWNDISLPLQNKRHRRRLSQKKKKHLRRKSTNGVPLETRKRQAAKREEETRFAGYEKIIAPREFSLNNNTEQVLNFIHKIEEAFDKRRRVFINLRNVETIAHGAIVVLLSVMVRFKSNNIEFNGNFPSNRAAHRKLQESGFLELLFKSVEPKDSYNLGSKIFTHADKKVDPVLTSGIISDSSKLIWKEERRCLGMQRVFVELMHNTNNHASLKSKGDKHWWATSYYDNIGNKMCYSFIDFGVGIFQSLANKPAENKFFGIMNKVKELFDFKSESELLKLLLLGKVHETATLQCYRGKGLPGIYEQNTKGAISNLIIISNGAYADVTNDRYIDLENKLSGTYIYWELNENSINIK